MSKSPKNILAETQELSLIDIFLNVSLTLRFFYLLVSVAEAKRTCSLQKRLKNYQRSTMTQDRLTGLATLSISCEMDKKT